MAEITSSLSFWIQASNSFFLLAGLHGDLLIIRVTLFVAYLLLVANSVSTSGIVGLDSLIWSAVSVYVHGSSLVALVVDEREVVLSEDAAALWRMMYRTGGLSKRLFQAIVARDLSVVEYAAGDTINTDDYFYIVFSGQVRLQVVDRNVSVSSRILVSGEMFDLKIIGFFTEQSVFDTGIVRCTALTPIRLFRITKEDMKKIAHHPLAKGVWQALLINNLSYVVESYLSEERKSRQAELYRDKIFRPLEAWEEPKPSLAGSGQALLHPLVHLGTYIQRSFSPPWPFKGHPTGIRQTLLPPPPQRPVEPQEPPRFHSFGSRSTTDLSTAEQAGNA